MTQHIADDFKHARFATHPDGRIAARVDDAGDLYAWCITGDLWRTDAAMAKYGWSPLDETRPVVVTDEDVDMALCRYYGKVHPHENGWDEHLRERMRAVLTAALSAAPTSDEDEGDPSVDYHAMWWKAEREREQAEAFAALWKETARRAIRRARVYGDMLRVTEARAEKAEQEREGLRVALEKATVERNRAELRVEDLESMTAREHLDAAWSAAYVPADGIIPEGAACIEREVSGDFNLYPHGWTHHGRSANAVYNFERRLLDVPTPKRPEGAEALEAVLMDADREVGEAYRTDGYKGLADFLAERGVRAPEDGEER